MQVRGNRRRYAVVAALLALAFGSAAIAGQRSRSASKGSVSQQRTHGMATAAPVVNFRRLTQRKRHEARKLMGRERDVLPERWQRRRSEERRVGKECRSRWSPYPLK